MAGGWKDGAETVGGCLTVSRGNGYWWMQRGQCVLSCGGATSAAERRGCR